MKAAVWYGYRDVRVMDVPEPFVLPGYVKVKVAWAGICGTDRHEYVGPVFMPYRTPHRLTGKMTPLIMGHEFTGIISEIGEGVEGWKVGDRIAASGNLVCGECRWCRSGRINICEKLGFNGISRDGGFAEYAVIPAYQLFRIPDNVSLEEAALAEPLACGMHAVKLIGDLTGKKVVIIGPGMIGMSCLIAARLAGAEKILVISSGTGREQLVKKQGADAYVAAKKEDPEEFVKEWTDSKMADVAFECVGLEQTLKTAVRLTRNGGTIMVMGVYEKEPRFPINYFQEGERVLLSSQAYIDEIAAVLDNMSKGLISTSDLITSRISLDRIVEDGFEELLRTRDKHVKILVKIADLE